MKGAISIIRQSIVRSQQGHQTRSDPLNSSTTIAMVDENSTCVHLNGSDCYSDQSHTPLWPPNLHNQGCSPARWMKYFSSNGQLPTKPLFWETLISHLKPTIINWRSVLLVWGNIGYLHSTVFLCWKSSNLGYSHIWKERRKLQLPLALSILYPWKVFNK